jgi:hypothetical protein
MSQLISSLLKLGPAAFGLTLVGALAGLGVASWVGQTTRSGTVFLVVVGGVFCLATFLVASWLFGRGSAPTISGKAADDPAEESDDDGD